LVYQSAILNPNDTPHTYIKDTCQYLQKKWDPNNSPPGTIAMAIMFHSITPNFSDLTSITPAQFNQLMQDLKDKGFATVTSEQLADFLEHNAKIPTRSVVLILDDRRPGTVSEVFFPILEQNNWTLTLAWPIGDGDNSTDNKPASNVLPGENFTTLWEQMEAYYSTGLLDVQSHGYIHNIPINNEVSQFYMHSELEKPIPILEQHFGKKPIAVIWPGGGFTQRATEIARAAGYRLGFTINPRGPVMFNWVPLQDFDDPRRPSYITDGTIGDPLMVLPRYWDTDAVIHLDEVIQIGQEAAAYAEANKATELAYYDIVCAPDYGPIPVATP